MLSVGEVVALIGDGPAGVISGAIAATRATSSTEQFEAVVRDQQSVEPVHVGDPSTPLSVWRSRRKYRVESAFGELLAVSDGVREWRAATQSREAAMTPAGTLAFTGPGRSLLTLPPLAASQTETTTMVTSEYLSRPCWTLHDALTRDDDLVTAIVDAETFCLLSVAFDATGLIASYSRFQVVAEETSFFTLPDGPAGGGWRRLRQDRSDAASKELKVAAFIEKYRYNLVFDDIDLTIAAVVHDNDDEFEVIVGTNTITGRLARRDRSDTEWYLPFEVPVAAWSTARHDWFIATYGSPLSDDMLRQLQHRLHPEAAITGGPTIVQPHG